MSDAHSRELFDRIRAHYHRENWLSPEGMRSNPWLRQTEQWSGRENLQRRYFWTDEQGTEYLHREFIDYDKRDGRELIGETDIPVPSIAYPPATEDQLRATEETLGFPLPPLLRALYAEVANGGVGPGMGIMGVIGGFEDQHGTIVDAYLYKKEHHRFVDLAECEKLAEVYTGYPRPYKLVSDLFFELPIGVWPEQLLEFDFHGCSICTCIDVSTGRIFLLSDGSVVFYEANSLEEWLERWLHGEMFMEVEQTPLSDEFP